MRRYRRRSLTGSFAYGLVIAASGAGLAVAAHHVLAPPGPESEVAAVDRNVAETASATLDRWSRLFGMHRAEAGGTEAPAKAVAAPAAGDVEPEARPDVGERQRVVTAEASKALVRNIQTELQRVGCYTGGAHGNWDMPTQMALAAFNEVVKVQIGSSGPEYVHLTLLQGHGTRACARPCTVEDGLKACVPRPAVAKARPAGAPRSPAAESDVARPEAPRVAAAPLPPAAVPTPPSPVLIREGSWRPATGAMPPAAPPPAQSNPPPASPAAPQLAAAPPSAAPLPGRSALGGPSPATDPVIDRRDQPSLPPAAIAPTAAGPAAPPTAARPGAAPRRETRETSQARRSGGGSGEAQGRSREIFTRLNRDSP